MQHLPRSRLLEHHGGRHCASEPHLRIQVLPVPVPKGDGEALFTAYHGELLVNCLDGACTVKTSAQQLQLAAGDQGLLVDGEPFRIDAVDGGHGVVQLVWAPGLNPCRTCWERDGRFFEPGG